MFGVLLLFILEREHDEGLSFSWSEVRGRYVFLRYIKRVNEWVGLSLLSFPTSTIVVISVSTPPVLREGGVVRNFDLFEKDLSHDCAATASLRLMFFFKFCFDIPRSPLAPSFSATPPPTLHMK